MIRRTYLGLPFLGLALSLASCATATATDSESEPDLAHAQDLTETTQPGTLAPLTHAELLAAEALVLFSHDHIRNTDATGKSPHFQDALAGGVTAMTLELIVDNLTWRIAGQEVFGPVGSGATGVEFFPVIEPQWHISQRFDQARADLDNIILHSGGQVRLVRTVQDIDDAKANGQLGIIIGTEGALMLSDNDHDTAANVLANVELRYTQGWRKTQLHRVYKTPFVDFSNGHHISPLGKSLVRMLNKRGVIVDAMHLGAPQIDDLFEVTSAPLQVSHDWAVCGTGALEQPALEKIVASGGGHGVISINVLASAYNRTVWVDGEEVPCGPYRSKDIHGFVDTLVDTIVKVGIDHVGIGPDYMPEGSNNPQNPTYALPAPEGTPVPIVPLIDELLSRGFTDEQIKKILGGNLRDLYQRIWDPTHGYDGGPAHFRLCSNTDADPACVAARSNSGQGDLRHRAINCGHPSGLTPVGSKLAYLNGQWVFKNLAGAWVPCSTNAQGLALVVSWGDGELQNGRIAIHGTAACDASCQQAVTWGGAGTANARALSCQSATSNGIVGHQLVYTAGAWHFYNIAGQLIPCLGSSTLVANWSSAGVPSPNANVRLCDDYNNHPACAAAASYAGNGTAQAKALSCLSSTPGEHGTTSLQVFYSDKDFDDPNPANWNNVLPEGGHWRYWDSDGTSHRCVHGSVLIATTL